MNLSRVEPCPCSPSMASCRTYSPPLPARTRKPEKSGLHQSAPKYWPRTPCRAAKSVWRWSPSRFTLAKPSASSQASLCGCRWVRSWPTVRFGTTPSKTKPSHRHKIGHKEKAPQVLGTPRGRDR
nr:hypothetical protein pM02_c7_01 [uncultured bacterium]